MIEPIDFLKEAQRLDILEKIYQLRPHWQMRNPMFGTLGTALYLDASPNFDEYRNKVRNTNAMLHENFSFLYDHLKETLQKTLQEDVAYEETLALPGFHIFLAPQNNIQLALMKQTPPSIHFDLQFLQANWGNKQAETSRPVSFTASIKLPSGGGGLNYWDITYNDYKNLSIVERDKLFNFKERHYCPYQEGKIVIHDGFTLHQIAVLDEYKTDDVRITLQGHAIRCDQTWKIYW
ncbi:MAG: hypothetical protein WCG42_06210 [Parachlamydiaceae bacterium]